MKKITLDVELSDEDIASIEHFVPAADVDAWIASTFENVVKAHLLDQINGLRSKYLQAKAQMGDKYMNRDQRIVQEQADILAAQETARQAKAAEEAEFQKRVDAAVAVALAKQP